MNKNCTLGDTTDQRKVFGKIGQFSSSKSLPNCDSKANQCNRYSSDASISGQKGSKLSINDESSHPINGSNTNNKKRKRNNKMPCDGDKKVSGEDEGEVRDNMKRIKVDVNGDGHDNDKTRMFQVSAESSPRFLLIFIFQSQTLDKSFAASSNRL